ncbi:MAG: hypothetical protein A2Z07_04555 [Armatimonadetes bacterium RBG_16_67_12]|nr:MAG: hypothetical protein A2Z07_04555 [Armatimonadetes bacterium RBG_16_67_12]
MRLDEYVHVLGRRFALRIEGPLPPGRYEVHIWEGRRWPWKRPYLRAPIRGRSPDEARERALDVLYNYVGLDRFRVMAEEIARRVAPGASVEVGEDAREVTVALAGPYALEVPLVVSRSEVLSRGADVIRLRGLVRAHLEAYVKLVSAPPR